MALFRALEDARPRGARLFADPYARAFLRAPLKLVVSLAKIPGLLGPVRSFIDRRWPGTLSSGVARTRFIDDRVCAALSDGVEQLVLLGAGFDSRPYRLGGCERITVFEVDHPATLARRQQVLASLRGSCAWVRSVPIDFDRDRIETVLAAAGYVADRPTLFPLGRCHQLPDRERHRSHPALVRSLASAGSDHLHLCPSRSTRRPGSLLRRYANAGDLRGPW
jgi:methyltransferase (TIGR00027 family)